MAHVRRTSFYENIVLGIFIAGFSFLLYIARTSPSYAFGNDVASMTFPSAILGLMILLCVIKLVMNYMSKDKSSDDAVQSTPYKIYILLCAIIAYAFLWNGLGFSLSTAIFAAAMSKMLRPTCSWKKVCIVAVAVAIFMNLVFGVLFGVDFPEPILELVLGY